MRTLQPGAVIRLKPQLVRSTTCTPCHSVHTRLSLAGPVRRCCAANADGFGEDAAAVGATGSVPDLSTMRLDSFHEARRATLAYITGDAAPLPSDTSTSGDSGPASHRLPSPDSARAEA